MLGVTYKSFMLSVIMLNVIMLSVIMLNVIMLSVIMLNVVMLSVVAPFDQTFLEEALNSLFCSALVYTQINDLAYFGCKTPSLFLLFQSRLHLTLCLNFY